MKHEVRPATFERHDARGSLVEIQNAGPWETVITGVMKAGAVMGNHYHKRTAVYFFLIRGAARIDIVDVLTNDRESIGLSASQGVLLSPHQSHAIRFREETQYILLKSHRFDPKDPDTFDHPVPE